jgi:ankyrin repeat protein
VVRYLVEEAKADPNGGSGSLPAPLTLAAENNHFATVWFLIEAGANKNARGKDANTAMHLAAGMGSLVLVR